MRKLFLLALFLLANLVVVAQDRREWQRTELGNGIKPAIAIDSDDVIHVAYITEERMGAVFYVTDESGAWETTTVNTGYFYGPLDIAVNNAGSPLITYHDHQSERFDPALGDPLIATIIEGEWNILTLRNAGHDGWDNSIAVDENGFWHAAWIDPEQFNPSSAGAEYATNAYSDEGTFIIEDVPDGPAPYEFGTTVAVTSDGTVGVAYFSAREDSLLYAERSAGVDGTWSLTTVDSGGAGRYASLQFDSQGNPHIAYFVKGSAGGTIRYAQREGDDNWLIEDVAELTGVEEGMQAGTARKIVSLVIDDSDVAHLAYTNNIELTYAVQGDDGLWSSEIVTSAEIEGAPLGSLVEMALDSTGQAHIVYYVVQSLRPLDARVMYATLNDG
jgi:hypothetical protein